MTKSEFGKRIKSLRKAKGLTQSALAGSKITRNMLSSIENGVASPSIETLEYLAKKLSVTSSYLLSEDDNLLFFEKNKLIDKIYRAYDATNYKACIELISSLPGSDDETEYLLAECHLELAKHFIAHGSLVSAGKHLESAMASAKITKINTNHIEAQISLYISVTKNIQSPLLEFNSQKYLTALNGAVEFEIYKYITQDFSYAFHIPALALHMEAKVLINERNYTDAVKRLLNAVELIKNESYNAYFIFCIYTDLENCYKQLYNFEKAYFYSTKRMTLLEGFKS
jgi:transcriptional regulator with XRE-family HTH domain